MRTTTLPRPICGRDTLSTFTAFTAMLLAATAVSGLAAMPQARAQDTVLDPVIVSAGLSPVAEKEVTRAYTVIGAEQIERSKAGYIADLLRQVPGVAVSASGSAGATTQVRMRGAEANHVLVLIDGVPASETSTGEYDFGRLQVSDVERIEVLRGPQSAFWGSNAMAGVINIVTRSGGRDGLHTIVGTEFGSDGTRMGSARVEYGQDNFDISGSVTARHTDGFNVSNFGSELDGATHLDAHLQFNADITPTLSIDGSLRYAQVHADFDGEDWTLGSPTYGQVVDTFDTNQTYEALGALGFKWESDDGALFQAGRISGTRVDRDSYDTAGIKNGATTGDRYKLSYQIGRHFETPGIAGGQHTVTFGYDLIEETFRNLPSTSIIEPEQLELRTRTTNSFVGEYRGRFADQLNLTAALRHDINDTFENATTYSLGSAWQIPETGTTLHASVGTGVTNPTFVEQFGYYPSTFIGNPALMPETSFGWDIGFSQSVLDERLIFDVTYFDQTLENEITTVFGPTSTVINGTGTSTRRGVEVSAALDLFNGFSASASYTYTDSRDGSGLPEIRRPRHSGAIGVAYAFDEIPLRLNADLDLVGESGDTDFSTYPETPVTLPGYALLSAGVNYQLSENAEIYARATNLLDVKYQTVLGYNNAGRAVYVGARARF